MIAAGGSGPDRDGRDRARSTDESMRMTTLDAPQLGFDAALDVAALTADDLPADAYGELAEIAEFEQQSADWRAGKIDDDEFRTLRLHMGCYGIRQSDTHMLRIKAPLGKITARQLEAMAVISERYSRGHGHLTTRQAIQFHFVTLDDAPDAMRVATAAGLTTREACGNAIRNVTMSPMAGVHPDEVLDVEAAADEVVRHFLRHGQFQRLPRKFKLAFSAALDDDCGTGFHDVGVIPAINEAGEPGYRIVLGGGLGSAPHEAVALEPFTPAAWLLPTVQAALELFEEHGERRNRVRARMKFLVKKLGKETFVAEIMTRREAAIARGLLSTIFPHDHALTDLAPVALPDDLPAELAGRDVAAYRHWARANTIRQRDGQRFAVYCSLMLGDLTTEQFRAVAEVMEDNDIVDARLTIRQNIVLRDVTADRLPHVWAALEGLDLDRPMAEKSGDIVSCPGAETCNLALTQSRGLGETITSHLVETKLDQVPGISINISGCPNSCGQHQAFEIGFSGMARRDALGNEGPGYRVYVGAHVEEGGAKFGDYVAKVPAKHAATAAERLISTFQSDGLDGEPFWQWAERIGRDGLKAMLKDLDVMPSKAEDESYYVDLGQSTSFEVILGQSECA